MVTDTELALAAQRGDVVSLGILLERYRAPLYARALGMLGHGPDAQDALHDAFFIALRDIQQLRHLESASSWLHGIVRNICLRKIRELRRERDFTDMPLVIEHASVDWNPGDAIDRLALRDWVWTALSELPDALRATAILRYFGSCASYNDIASILGIPLGTVRSRLNQAKIRLAGALLETATRTHDEARRITEQQVLYFEAAFAEYNRGEGYELFANAFAEDCVIAISDGAVHHGRGWVSDESEGDLIAGMKLHLTNVVASKDVTVIEGNYENPPDDPFRCPPAISMVGFYGDGQIGHMRMHFAPRLPLQQEATTQ